MNLFPDLALDLNLGLAGLWDSIRGDSGCSIRLHRSLWSLARPRDLETLSTLSLVFGFLEIITDG